MSEEIKTVEVQVITPEMEKRIAEITGNTITAILKKDYRATIVHREEKSGIDDSEAALIHIDEEKTDELGNPVELDYKGTIDRYDAYLFRETRYAQALMRLKKWQYFEETLKNRDGSIEVVRIPVNLAQLVMTAKQRINMSVGGSQSWKHIQERRANAGRMEDDSIMNKIASWSGVKRERVNREEMQATYGNNQQHK